MAPGPQAGPYRSKGFLGQEGRLRSQLLLRERSWGMGGSAAAIGSLGTDTNGCCTLAGGSGLLVTEQVTAAVNGYRVMTDT